VGQARETEAEWSTQGRQRADGWVAGSAGKGKGEGQQAGRDQESTGSSRVRGMRAGGEQDRATGERAESKRQKRQWPMSR
jgi:hypothetical protein